MVDSKPCMCVTLISLTLPVEDRALLLLHRRLQFFPTDSRVAPQGPHVLALAPSWHSATPGCLSSPRAFVSKVRGAAPSTGQLRAPRQPFSYPRLSWAGSAVSCVRHLAQESLHPAPCSCPALLFPSPTELPWFDPDLVCLAWNRPDSWKAKVLHWTVGTHLCIHKATLGPMDAPGP